MERARALRLEGSVQGSGGFRASAEGHVYFFVERDDGGAPIPVRVDQVAVDLYASPPNRSRQIIRALRRRELLPVKDFEYYLDRLILVQGGFEDWIAVGQGRDVRRVPHPLGRYGAETYRFRIAGRVSLRWPELEDPIVVRTVEVLPIRDDLPGVVGSMDLEEGNGGLVRMSFAFTKASYLDPRTDRVEVQLEHRRFAGGLWLPWRQLFTIRRESTVVDLPFGSVIRSRLEVLDYEFDPELEPGFFERGAVSRPSYGDHPEEAFRSGLEERLAEEGLQPVSLGDVREEAREAAKAVARQRLESALPRLRLSAPSFSRTLRLNRAEGPRLAAGIAARLSGGWTLAGRAGFGFGNRKASASASGRKLFESGSRMRVSAYLRRLGDAGPLPGASGALNSLSVLAGVGDYTDPYYGSGVRGGWAFSAGAGRLELEGVWERHHDAGPEKGLAYGRSPRLRPISAGARIGAAAEYFREAGPWGRAGLAFRARASGGAYDRRAIGTLGGDVQLRFAAADLSSAFKLRADGGVGLGRLPAHLLYFLGGRGTLPGHAFRDAGGKAFLLGSLEAWSGLYAPWIGGRLLAGMGWAGESPPEARAAWGLKDFGPRGYVGAGVSIFHDILRLDAALGIPGGKAELWMSLNPVFAPYL